ncbi:hypothetical protein MMC28_003742 [Mycoblastus sanguinarius]|nr:hypothetical protein [Mycoblastus sanguinarius]
MSSSFKNTAVTDVEIDIEMDNDATISVPATPRSSLEELTVCEDTAQDLQAALTLYNLSNNTSLSMDDYQAALALVELSADTSATCTQILGSYMQGRSGEEVDSEDTQILGRLFRRSDTPAATGHGRDSASGTCVPQNPEQGSYDSDATVEDFESALENVNRHTGNTYTLDEVREKVASVNQSTGNNFQLVDALKAIRHSRDLSEIANDPLAPNGQQRVKRRRRSSSFSYDNLQTWPGFNMSTSSEERPKRRRNEDVNYDQRHHPMDETLRPKAAKKAAARKANSSSSRESSKDS